MSTSNSGSSWKDLNLNENEVNNLMSAMEKPEFAKLFREYLDEIKDPKHREENELYLRQLEREQREGLDKNDPLAPKSMQIVIPHEEFCFKTKTLDRPEMRVYINVCSSEKVERVKDEKGKNETGKEGTFISVPVLIGKERMEQDKDDKSKYYIVDVTFHPDAIKRCAASPRFKDFLIKLAIEHASKRLEGKPLSKKYKILKIKSKGLPGAMSLVTKEEPKTSITGTSHMTASPSSSSSSDQDKKRQSHAETETDIADSLMKAFEQTMMGSGEDENSELILNKNSSSSRDNIEKKPLINEISSMESEPVKPTYEIIHRGVFDIGQYTTARRNLSNIGVPEFLVVRVYLPHVTSASSIDLEFEEKSMFLSESNYNYKIDIALPFLVNSEDGDAKFIKAKHMLEVVLPVIMPQEEMEKYEYDGPSGFDDHEQKTVIEVVKDLRKQRLPSYDDDNGDDDDGNGNGECIDGGYENGTNEQEPSTGDQDIDTDTDSDSNRRVHISGENVVHEFDAENAQNAHASQTVPNPDASPSNAETSHETQDLPKIDIEIKNTLMYELD